MPLKPRYKRRIIWSIISILGLLILAFIIVPPMIHFNSLKPKIEKAIFAETGIKATIHGNINLSLLGKTTITAHNITLPNGFVSYCTFSIPLSNIFNIDKAQISKDITVNGASVKINKIVPFDINNRIIVNNSKFHFLNKEYEIINADLSKDIVNALIRTDQHKYEIKSIKNNFTIKNQNNNLTLSGQLLPDGTANGHINIVAQNINKWFEFKYPRITKSFPVTADITWDGGYGITFYNISSDGISGNIELLPDGYKNIKLQSKTANYDMSFAVKHPDIFKNSSFNIDFYGDIKFINKTFHHLFLNIIGNENSISIKDIIADDLILQGGKIDKDGAHNITVSLTENNVPTKCLFNGNPNKWSCDTFIYGDTIRGNLTVNDNFISANINSDEQTPKPEILIQALRKLADNGTIKFLFKDSGGTLRFTKNKFVIQYDFATGKTLKWANINLKFLPEFMLSEPGDFVWQNNHMIFTPYSKTWSLMTKQDYFYITGDNFKKWLPDTDLQSMNDLPYTISGNYKNGNISDLILEIAKHKFTGSVSGKNITLKTKLLNLDDFISKTFLDNYEDLSFFTNLPIMIPFVLNTNISLSADSLVYNGRNYNNFVYSLKPNTQTFSITDSNRGNLLATLKKKNNYYDINIQLNKFVQNNKLLPNDMPLNISDSMITAEIKLKTFGKIAHDIIENINGVFDLSFDGGKLYGLGLADFYANAQNITILNAEYALADALEHGITPIKNMRLIGTYNNGNIQTTKPILLSLKHTDATGILEITDNKMLTKLKLILRGTSSEPAPIDLVIYPDNKREYSLSEIMMSFDPEYMRTFTQSHNRF